MAERAWGIARAFSLLFFILSGSFLVTAYAQWQWPDSKWPMYENPEAAVAEAIVFFLIGVLVFTIHRRMQRLKDALEK